MAQAAGIAQATSPPTASQAASIRIGRILLPPAKTE